MLALAESGASIRRAVEAAMGPLSELSEEQASERWRGAGTWSRKKLLGHLIDSAANNHQRFVRAAIDGSFSGMPYAQEQWVTTGAYQELPWTFLITLWQHYNLLLAHVLERVDAERASAAVRIGEEQLTLAAVAEDYPRHMRHHLAQILG
ncbi:MAG: DinB family protein [Bryobacterales bacterium]|nr:DinB family protein [Bryobacterales bacterium]